ncbi:MAG: ATP-binding protein [Planctomycetia bacterium]|nr:MAG: ATP-binding protein [Planctomycetia bacterium]
MSYRSLTRVIGETSLERKCRLLFGSCLLLLITGSFWWYGNETDKLVLDANRRSGDRLVEAILMSHHWVELEEKYRFEGHTWDPKDLAEKLRTNKYKSRWILPTGPANPERIMPPRDALEQELLDEWQKAGRGVSSDDKEVRHDWGYELPGAHVYRYYQPIYAKKKCIVCHRDLGPGANQYLTEGDLMAVVQVSFKDEETVKARRLNRAILLAVAISAVSLSMIALYVIVRYVIVKPLSHLRDVSEKISRGNTEVRAEIHTGDEFEELGNAFNRMLRHMVDAQDNLRQLNRDLDAKVDQLAQVNMRLYESNRIKTDFLATVSHELRTPLNSIIGFSDVLHGIDSLDDKQKRYVTNIQRSGRMLLEMINDVLDLAKIESGKMETRLSEFSIDSVVAAQCDMARPLTEKKNIDLEYQIQPQLPDLVQDQSKVQQILNNLLSNAIKFTPEGGRITLTARRDDVGWLELIVEDTGVGIAEDDQTTIFEKFRQGSFALSGGDAMTREYSGTGLGLSIVKELCRLLGGEISLTSELGRGSIFTVRLPWTRTAQPQLESDLADGLGELAKARPFDIPNPSDPHLTPPTPTP